MKKTFDLQNVQEWMRIFKCSQIRAIEMIQDAIELEKMLDFKRIQQIETQIKIYKAFEELRNR